MTQRGEEQIEKLREEAICPGCKYSLRGLPGEVVTCPECGREINIALLIGGLLHDIGKVGVPEAILDSPNRLSAEEWVEIKKHPMIGARILAPIGAFADIIPIVRHHHEKWDGTGYPMGLSAMEIPRLARVLAVADVFDAMTSDRPYRAGMADEVALQIIEKDAGTHFDPVVARLLRPTLIRVGSEVRADRELAGGEVTDLAVGE